MVTSPIPRYLLPHTAVLTEQIKGSWGNSDGIQTVLHFVRIEPCRAQRFSLGGDIPEIKAKMFFDTVSSEPKNVSFETGDRISFCGTDFVIAEVNEFYGLGDRIHHLEVLLK